MERFIKPAIDVVQQIELLTHRGLRIRDPERAKSYLEVISFFRLSAYMRPFQIHNDPDHKFKANTEFKMVVDLYAFDRELRLLVMDAIERVEVAVRATLNNHMGLKYQNDVCNSGSHWYLQEALFKHNYAHKRLLKEVEDKQAKEHNDLKRDITKIERSNVAEHIKQNRIEHRVRESYPRFYGYTYSSPKLMPELAIQPKKPNAELWFLPERLKPTQIQPQRRVYMVLLMLAYLMKQVSPDSQWHNKVKALILLHPEVPLIPMGFPGDWLKHRLWCL